MQQTTNLETEQAFTERIARVRAAIDDAARRSGRAEGDILLVAVSKTVDRATIDQAYQLGLREFGENRVQDALEKFDTSVPDDLQLHMIGSLQTNKANQVTGRFDLIHSVDRKPLATAIDKRARNIEVVQRVLVQVNVSREDQKHGCDVNEVDRLLDDLSKCEGLRVEGFMTMAPFVATPDEARPVFNELREISVSMHARYPELPLEHLSMGMTNDFVVAIEEGATIVRVGRALFQDTAGS